MRNAKPQCFHVPGKNFTENEKFQKIICLKPEDEWFCILNIVMSPYNFYEFFSFLVRKFSNLSIIEYFWKFQLKIA